MLQLTDERGNIIAGLEMERTTIGRDPTNDVVLEDESISGFHAVILNDRGNVSIVDLGSTNGSSVNGAPVKERTELKAWHNLQLGASKLQVIDPNGRRPTRVQAAVNVDAAQGRGGVEQPTLLRPALRGQAAASPPKDGGGIRFESLRDGSVPTKISAPAAAAATRVAPAAAKTRVAAPAATRAASRATVPAGPYAQVGGYPRGLVWLLFSCNGRIRRSLFWKSMLPLVLLAAGSFGLFWIGIAALDFRGGVYYPEHAVTLAIAASAALYCWPCIAVLAKRLHDFSVAAIPWCAALGATWVLSALVNLLASGNPAPALIIALRVLQVAGALAVIYAFGLALLRHGERRANAFGDQNPHNRIVFR